MKQASLALVLGGLLLAPPAASVDSAPGDPPRVILHRGGAGALWVGAELVGPGGTAEAPMAPEAGEAIRSLLARPPDAAGCIAVGTADAGDYALGPHKPAFAGDGPRIARLVQASTFVLLGRVSGASPGFGEGIPGQLLGIEPEEVLHGAAPLPKEKRYVILPRGTFVAAGRRICKRSDIYPEVVPGQEVLLFVSDAWGDRDQVYRVSYLQIIPVPARGEIRFPWTLDAWAQAEGPRERAALLAYLRGLPGAAH